MNWQNIITDLIEAGWTQAQIGEYVGKQQSWVSYLMHGRFKGVAWDTGEALRKLHSREMRKQKTRKQEPQA